MPIWGRQQLISHVIHDEAEAKAEKSLAQRWIKSHQDLTWGHLMLFSASTTTFRRIWGDEIEEMLKVMKGTGDGVTGVWVLG